MSSLGVLVGHGKWWSKLPSGGVGVWVVSCQGRYVLLVEAESSESECITSYRGVGFVRSPLSVLSSESVRFEFGSVGGSPEHLGTLQQPVVSALASSECLGTV